LSYGLHQATIPTLSRALRNAATILDKADAWAVEKQKSTPSVLSVEQGLVQLRLVPDMFPFARQLQIATDVAKGCAARLAGIDPPKYEDTEASFAELKARLATTVAFLESVDAAAVDASVGRTIALKSGGRELSFSAPDYVAQFVIPNVFFHLTMAYALLRQAGVPVGKLDFLGA
jgi:hypothetical protein